MIYFICCALWDIYIIVLPEFNIAGYTIGGEKMGIRDRVSYLMEQGNINLIFTSFLNHDSPIAEHVKLHGDGVRDISLKVPNIDETSEYVKKRGCPVDIVFCSLAHPTDTAGMLKSIIPLYEDVGFVPPLLFHELNEFIRNHVHSILKILVVSFVSDMDNDCA